MFDRPQGECRLEGILTLAKLTSQAGEKTEGASQNRTNLDWEARSASGAMTAAHTIAVATSPQIRKRSDSK